MKLNSDRLKFLLFAVTFFGAMFIYWWAFPPSEPIDRADGVYANPCCGSFSLRHGMLRTGNIEVPYVVEHDKEDRPYVLPKVYVGVFNGNHIGISQKRWPLMLDLDDAAMPPTIRLVGDDGYEYLFESQAPE